ncbi:hypothetical protein [Emticicia sp. TH156]|uniref:hypothetical protein n=1 Tax=Emticicia sp. TH156 TaxID=2067454 RepID=UPI000C766229|nr:hypothetical protein [Emticicia sp. TH156]PLK44262.1 hypothetical protein C0V77_10720 [Emticicia sp. TH156]
MKVFWSPYINHFMAFDFSIEIPLNEENYKQKILEFDACLFEKGAEFGIYNFIEAEKIYKGEAHKYINDYVASRTENMFKPETEGITLGGIYHWDYYLNSVNPKTSFTTINIPVFDNGEWQYKAVDPFGLFTYDSALQNFESHLDYKTKSKWNNIVEIEFFSQSNIWYDEIEYSQLERRYMIFDPPADNRPVAYRISPRFNSFLRDLKSKTYSLGGKYILNVPSSKLSDDGYILLDGQVIFQEDIDCGVIKIPDRKNLKAKNKIYNLMKRILPVVIAVLIIMMSCLPTFANDDKDDPSKNNSQPIAKTKSYSKYRTFAPAQNLVSKQILASVEHQIESLEQEMTTREMLS